MLSQMPFQERLILFEIGDPDGHIVAVAARICDQIARREDPRGRNATGTLVRTHL